MYIETVPNRNSPPTVLLRESWRAGNKTIKKTLSNLSHWPTKKITIFRKLLKNEPLASPEDIFETEESIPHGHVAAILKVIRRLKLEQLIASKPCRERNLVVAMLVSQLLYGCSKLGETRLWQTTTLARELNIRDADENDLYYALDWLLARQNRIENKLAKRHFPENSLVFYDISSSYYEGHTCLLARFGHSRDKKKGKKIIVYGVMADIEGRPIAIRVYPGNTADPTTIPDQVQKIRTKFLLDHIVLVGDRGMLTQTQIKYIKKHPGIGWISGLKSKSIRNLMDKGRLKHSTFKDKNLAEISSPDYPEERLIACYNAKLADERKQKRNDLLDATEKNLLKIQNEVNRRTKKILKKEEIGIKVGKVINRHKMGKHFKLVIGKGKIDWERKEDKIIKEKQLDGIYIIRTSESESRLSSENTVRRYKNLCQVERIFRTCKGIDIRIRPIRHRTTNHVKAHIFLCNLAYYIEWHMRKALAPILFHDEELDENRKVRDPVAKAEPSDSVKKKKSIRKTAEGLTIHSFDTLLKALATQCKNRCVQRQIGDGITFEQTTKPNALQQKAHELLETAPM